MNIYEFLLKPLSSLETANGGKTQTMGHRRGLTVNVVYKWLSDKS
jgi:hypothetical protein